MRVFCALGLSLGLAAGASATGRAQNAANEASAEAAALQPQSVVRWAGQLTEQAGKSPSLRFAIYQAQAGGLPLWSETQTVNVDREGRFTVLLGAASSEGLPGALFQGGVGRWLSVEVAGGGEKPTARSLLASVPYALKSVDAETLGGRAAIDYVTREELVQAPGAAAGSAAAGADPAAKRPVAGAGLASMLPLWTGAATLGSSIVSQSNGRIGIGTAKPAAILDVAGAAVVRGSLALPATHLATAAAGADSNFFEIMASAYSSTLGAPVTQAFAWQANPKANNTAAPTATFELLYGKGTAPLAPTGFSFTSNGQMIFAPGQKFPGAGTITGITTASPLTGSGTAGSVALGLNTAALTATLETTLDGRYPQLNAYNNFTGSSTNFAGWIEANASGGAGSAAVQGWGASEAMGVFGHSDSSYGVQGVSGTYYGVLGSVDAPTIGSAGVIGATGPSGNYSGTYEAETAVAYAGVWADTSASSTSSGLPVGMFATADLGYAAAAINNSSSFPALYAENTRGTSIQAISLTGDALTATTSTGGSGVVGQASSVGMDAAGVLGMADGHSAVYGSYGVWGGVWGDTATSKASAGGDWPAGMVGTADDTFAGIFMNNSATAPTMYIHNFASGGATGLFKTLMVSSADGTCGVGSGGSLTCTGPIKSLAPVAGSRTVETYAVQASGNWMEDFGSGQLVKGVATIELEPEFAGTVNAEAGYHVYLTPNGDSKGLYVINKSARGFEVRESGGGTSSLGFDYRIVARRRGYETARLADVTETVRGEMARTAIEPASHPLKPLEVKPSPLLAALAGKHRAALKSPLPVHGNTVRPHGAQ